MKTNILLASLGLTPDQIKKYVIKIDHTPARPYYHYEPVKVKPPGWVAKQKRERAERARLGQNQATGLPLRRSPNGTRKARQEHCPKCDWPGIYIGRWMCDNEKCPSYRKTWNL